MQALSELDASFLHVERPSLHMHIASVGIYEGPPVPRDAMATAVAAKLPLVPRYREKVRFVPLDLGAPVWVDDPDFSLDYHIRYTALPAPGGEAELRNLVGRLLEHPLDRSRPLWEMWVVEGLPDDRWALVSKLHHCMADGVASTDLMSVLLDTTEHAPAPPSAGPWHPEPEPGSARLIGGALGQAVRHGYEGGRGLLEATRHPARTFDDWIHVARALASLDPVWHRAPPTSLNGPVGPHRRWSFTRGRMADVQAIRKRFGGTVNDVVLAVVTNGFRELLLARGEDVEHEVVRTLVPVSVRAQHEHGDVNNRVSALYAELPIGEADPVARLEAVHAQMQRLKRSGQAEGGEVLTSVADLAPDALIAVGGRLAFGLPQRNLQTVTTNVPGPRQTLYLAGRRLLEVFPIVPIGPSMRIGVAIVSYEGGLNYGITGDYDTTADIDVLSHGIETGIRDLLRAAKRR